MIADGDGVRIKEVGIAFEMDYAGSLKELLMSITKIETGFELTGDNSGEAKGKILVLEFWVGACAGKGVGEIKCDSIRDVASVNIGATKICAFDNRNAFFSLGKV